MFDIPNLLSPAHLAEVTSVESMIRDEHRREIIADMAQVACFVQDVAANTPEEQRANKVYVNLLRLWSDV